MNFKFSRSTYATIVRALNKPVASAIIWVAWRTHIRAIVRFTYACTPRMVERAYNLHREGMHAWWSPQSQIMGICLPASSASMQRLGPAKQ